MQSWSDLFTSGIIPAGATAAAEYPDAFGAFLSKKAAFIALGTWNTPGTMTHTGVAVSQQTVTDKIDSVYLSAPFPAPEGAKAPTGLFGGPDNGWAVSAKSDSQDAALEFLKFLSLGDGQKIQASGGNIPAISTVKVATDDVIDPRQVADIERQQTDLGKLIGARQIPYSDLSAALGDALSAVAAGTMSPADALAQVQAASEAITR
jgi:raffinose/stachyose/melibiose transport system substrate-binding protein